MNSPCAPSLWRGVQFFLGKHVPSPACFGQLVFWLIVTGFSPITSPPLFAQTNDNTAPRGRRIARQKWINTLAPPRLPGFSLREFYAAKRIYRGLELFGSVDNFTDSRDPNLGAQLPIFRTELGECASRGRRSAAKARENWKIQWIRRLSKTANKGGAEAPA